MIDSEENGLISPATTPGSAKMDPKDFFNQPYFKISQSTKLPWYQKYPPPHATILISIIQIILYALADDEIKTEIRYEPENQKQIWRFITYMMVHDNLYHLLLNVVIQNLFAVILERDQGFVKVMMVYFGGGAVGALGASCLTSDRIVGASAGVYALLTSHVAHITLNYENTKYKTYYGACIAVIVVSDIIHNFIHSSFKGVPVIAWGAHGVGAITGFFLGLIMFRNLQNGPDKQKRERVKALRLAGLACFMMFLLFLIVCTYQVQRCTNFDRNGVKYFC